MHNHNHNTSGMFSVEDVSSFLPWKSAKRCDFAWGCQNFSAQRQDRLPQNEIVPCMLAKQNVFWKAVSSGEQRRPTVVVSVYRSEITFILMRLKQRNMGNANGTLIASPLIMTYSYPVWCLIWKQWRLAGIKALHHARGDQRERLAPPQGLRRGRQTLTWKKTASLFPPQTARPRRWRCGELPAAALLRVGMACIFSLIVEQFAELMQCIWKWLQWVSPGWWKVCGCVIRVQEKWDIWGG